MSAYSRVVCDVCGRHQQRNYSGEPFVTKVYLESAKQTTFTKPEAEVTWTVRLTRGGDLCMHCALAAIKQTTPDDPDWATVKRPAFSYPETEQAAQQ